MHAIYLQGEPGESGSTQEGAKVSFDFIISICIYHYQFVFAKQSLLILGMF